MSALIVIGKLAATALLVYLLAEVAKRSTMAAALLAAFPVATILAGTLLYWETGDTEQVAQFTSNVLRMICPSLVFFVAFPILLRRGISFGTALTISIALTTACYGLYALLLKWLAIKI